MCVASEVDLWWSETTHQVKVNLTPRRIILTNTQFFNPNSLRVYFLKWSTVLIKPTLSSRISTSDFIFNFITLYHVCVCVCAYVAHTQNIQSVRSVQFFKFILRLCLINTCELIKILNRPSDTNEFIIVYFIQVLGDPVEKRERCRPFDVFRLSIQHEVFKYTFCQSARHTPINNI